MEDNRHAAAPRLSSWIGYEKLSNIFMEGGVHMLGRIGDDIAVAV